ncbi:MAG: N-6 DNA methylase [Balneolaceae bacterium]|nr:N-6 DNA methylase [Balneolaceae bacterium]
MNKKIIENEIDALGSALLGLKDPTSSNILAEMISSGFLQNKFSEPDITAEYLEKIAKMNSDEFDLYNGVISLKDQRIENIDDQINEITSFVRKHNLSYIGHLLTITILVLRYDAVKTEHNLKDIGTEKFVDKFFNNPSDITKDDFISILNEFVEEYSLSKRPIELSEIDSIINNVEKFSDVGLNMSMILSGYDWRKRKIGIYDFEKLIIELSREFNPLGNVTTQSLSDFFRTFIKNTLPKRVAFLYQTFDNSIPTPIYGRYTDIEYEISEFDKKELLLKSLMMSVSGPVNIKLSNGIFEKSKEDLDLLIMVPLTGKVKKTDWKEILGEELEFDTYEEFSIRLSLKRLHGNGRAIFIISNDFLADKKGSSRKLKRQWIDSKVLEAVVKLPCNIGLPSNNYQISIVIINNKGVEKPMFIDCDSYNIHLAIHGNNDVEHYYDSSDFVDIAGDVIVGQEEKVQFSRYVSWNEIIKNKYDLSVQNYVNPKVFAEYHVRNKTEEILKLSDVVKRLKPNREEVSSDYHFLNMADLPANSGEFILNLTDLNYKSHYKSKLPLLKKDALLIGKVGRSLKPTLFKYEGKPLFIGSNVLALKIDDTIIDPEYLISELNSRFVQRQLENLPVGITIPNVKITDLLDLYIRVPQPKNQKEFFSIWINNIAKEKLKEIENLHESIKYIEKDVFSSFAHDFGKLQLKIASSIDALEAYIKLLNEKEVINLEDSVFGEEKPDEGERVIDVIHRLRESHHRSVEFLKTEVNSLTRDIQNNQIIDLGDLIIKWKSMQDEKYYKIKLTEFTINDSVRIKEVNNSFGDNFFINANESDVYKILDNILDNAIKHGFDLKKRENIFQIHLSNSIDDTTNLSFVSMCVGNSGKPFPKDFSFEDLFKRRHKGPKSSGEGLGGYSIKRALDNLGAEIMNDVPLFSKKDLPVQFTIDFKIVDHDE